MNIEGIATKKEYVVSAFPTLLMLKTHIFSDSVNGAEKKMK
jgi:hypothetical protein